MLVEQPLALLAQARATAPRRTTASRPPHRSRADRSPSQSRPRSRASTRQVPRYDATGIIYARTVFDPLTTVAADGTIQPYLAQAVTPNADYSEWTITMRPNVVFHDGTSCDAAAIVGSLEHFLSGEYSFTAKPIEHITATGPLTVSVKMNQPWVPFDAYLAGGIGGQLAWTIAPAMIANKNGTNHPIGTGPFVFQRMGRERPLHRDQEPPLLEAGPPLPRQHHLQADPREPSRATTRWLREPSRRCTPTTRRASRTSASETNIGYVDDSGPVLGEPDMGCILLNLAHGSVQRRSGSARPS